MIGWTAYLELEVKFVFEHLMDKPTLARPRDTLVIRIEFEPIRIRFLVGLNVLRRKQVEKE